MTLLDRLCSLKDQVGSCTKVGCKPTEEYLQNWKHTASVTIQSIFEEYSRCKMLLEKIDKLFNPLLIASTGQSPLTLPPENVIEEKLRADVAVADKLIDGCIEELNRLHEWYNPNREYCENKVHEKIINGDNHTFDTLQIDRLTTVNRPALSQAASKTLDAAMNAKFGCFEDDKQW